MTEMQHFDAIVIGLGGMGSAALFELAKRGKRVLGIEQFDVAHDMGSSHGVTRIIRLAYHEHPSYVPLMRRAYELWRELEATANEQILHITGSIDAGPPDGSNFRGSLLSCEEHDLSHDVLTSAELTDRFPGYRLPPDTMAVFQGEGGFLLPERCIALFIERAQELGATVHTGERTLEWESTANGVRVRTDHRVFEAESLIITAGAWTSKLLPFLGAAAIPERQVLAWFETLKPELFTPDNFPVFNLVVDEGQFYGFPEFGVPGFKLGKYHHLEENVDPDTINRQPNPQDEAVLLDFTEKYFPGAAGATSSMKVCMFTNSPDEHFIIDRLPDSPNVAVAAGFSGHGYKFSSVVGEILTDLTVDGETSHDIGMFRLSRFD